MLTIGLFFAILTVLSCRKYSEFWAIAGSQPQGCTWSPMKRTYSRPLSGPGSEMTEALDSVEVYQLRVWIREISPLIWRRLLVRSDSTIADLHYTLQIALAWSGYHLHQFIIRGKPYGVYQPGGIHFADNPSQVQLGDLRFRLKERFFYEYDFGDGWRHEIRVEQRVPLDPKKSYPVCIGGARAGPLEDCGGPWALMALREHYSPWKIADRLLDILDHDDWPEHRDLFDEELHLIHYCLRADKFDRRTVNRRLKQYALGDEVWQWSEGGSYL